MKNSKRPQITVNSELCGRFSAVLASTGLSQKEFGARIGQKQNAISQVDGKKRTPSKGMIQKIITEFGISPEWFYTGKGTMMPAEPVSDFISREDFAEWRGYWKAGEEKLLALVKDLDRRVRELERRNGISE